jgi:hypothetical protein
MQRGPTHASIGASTLGPTPPAQAWGDAFRSIQLVGTSTHVAIEADEDEEIVGAADPIEAARAWLADPARRRELGATLVECAEETLEVATLHLRELDLLAGELALEANETGELDPLRLERVDLMAGVMRAYAERMRDLLEPRQVESTEAERRLRQGLDAARDGGLSALVAAL